MREIHWQREARVLKPLAGFLVAAGFVFCLAGSHEAALVLSARIDQEAAIR